MRAVRAFSGPGPWPAPPWPRPPSRRRRPRRRRPRRCPTRCASSPGRSSSPTPKATAAARWRWRRKSQGAGFALAFDKPACVGALPFLATVAAWTPRPGQLDPPDRRLRPGGGGVRRDRGRPLRDGALRRGRLLPVARRQQRAGRPQPRPTSSAPGRSPASRAGDLQGDADRGAGRRGHLPPDPRRRLRPGHHHLRPGVVADREDRRRDRVQPSGDQLRFERTEDKVWRKVPEAGKPLLLTR